jgi:hypothetical protein
MRAKNTVSNAWEGHAAFTIAVRLAPETPPIAQTKATKKPAEKGNPEHDFYSAAGKNICLIPPGGWIFTLRNICGEVFDIKKNFRSPKTD